MKNSTFKWNAKYETGLAEVDAQHKSLVDLINHLGELRASGGSVADVTAALGALADYAKYHFSAEDALMQSAGISAEHTAAHRREHDQFLDQINQIVEEAQGDVMLAIDRLLRYLVKWLAFHILGQDTEMAVEIAALQRGAAPEAARNEAREQVLRGTEVLFDALNVLYDDLGASYVELSRAYAQLQQSSESRLKEAQRLAHLGSWELDLTKNLLTWSDEIYRIFEIDPERFGASYEAFLNAIHPEDRAKVNQAYQDSLRTRQPYEITHRLLMADGRVKHVHERCKTDYDTAGQPLRSLGTVQDVTLQAQAEEALRAQAQVDYLTGLANRRHFIEHGEEEIARTTRYRRPLSLLMLDIDHFKAINDTHGHQAGDAALQMLAAHCRDALREIDIIGRIGGEEFAIILPETAGAGASLVAERLRASIARQIMPTEKGAAVNMTVSIGLAIHAGDDAARLDDLLKQADLALYQAKRDGRNRVCVFADKEAPPPLA
ncbi:MAG: bacteriohemerythrin [Rhodocyclaceae bacterium]|nr:bacteriohemerythrin [Rhodocyclaceae bacterium]